MPEFSVIVLVRSATMAGLDAFLASLEAQTCGFSRLSVQFIGAANPSTQWRVDEWQALHGQPAPVSAADASLAAVLRGTAPWVAICEVAPLPPDLFERFSTCLHASEHLSDGADVLCAADPATLNGEPVTPEPPGISPLPWRLSVIRRERLADAGLDIDLSLPRLLPEAIVWSVLAQRAESMLVRVGACRLVGVEREPPPEVWRDPATYDTRLRQGLAAPLQVAARAQGAAPLWLQVAVLRQLHWYFTIDMRERAPTVIVTEAMAERFHEAVREVMDHVTVEAVELLEACEVSAEVRHLMLAYLGLSFTSPVVLDAIDHEQGLARVRYFAHGQPPTESFLVDGRPAEVAFAKYRACRVFHRALLSERIAWLPAGGATTVGVRLAGVHVPVSLGVRYVDRRFVARGEALVAGDEPQASALLSAARQVYPPGKGGQKPLPPGRKGWTVRLLRTLARFAPVRAMFAKAWVFIDREEGADDNAEHMYRWIRQHHPEINAWFLLLPESPDWPRLQREGFRLVPRGLKRRLLILNCEQIISSHTDYVFGGFDRGLYGDAMRWRFTFAQHGVIKDDLTQWLGPREFDLFTTSSPAEHASIVADGTTYPYTEREVKRVGLPRHDRLLQIASRTSAADVKLLLVMPTWRGSLVDDRMTASSPAERMAALAASDYVRHWRSFLRNEELRELAARHGREVVFMPHANAVSFVDAFDPPPHVRVATITDSFVQDVFARTAGFVTDYTSVAFTMAFLRRAVFYYQFDREAFYGGDHNWRQGYFDYERDGFGPVAFDEEQLIAQLRGFFANASRPSPIYLERMEQAMPDRDDQSCRRVYDAILAQGRLYEAHRDLALLRAEFASSD